MARWTHKENLVCLQEMPAYRREMSNVRRGEKMTTGYAFTKVMLSEYDVWINRKDLDLYAHMEYFNKLSAGVIEPTVNGDWDYFNILEPKAERFSFVSEEDSYKEDKELFVEVEQEEQEETVVEYNSEGYFLSDEEKEKLLAFVGYGDFRKSSIIFFGNEEGLAEGELANALQEKVEVFACHTDTYINRTDWHEGFYEIPENIPDSSKKIDFKSPMLEYQARIVKHLLEPERNWFLKKGESEEEYIEAKKYYQKDYLYRRESTFNISLLDLRPFPRKNEGGKWPYQNLDKSQYLRAFSFNPRCRISSEYKKLREDRAANLKRVILHSDAQYIIGIGAKDVKKRFFEQNFENVNFEGISLTKNKVQLYKAIIQGNGKTITILLSDFFDHLNIGLAGLEKLTKEHILL